MKNIFNFYDLDVWKQAHEYRLEIFRVSNEFPQKYQYSLGQQIQRAAISIGSNIAEGYGRQNKQEKKQFYRISRGSLTETQDQLILAKDLKLINVDKYKELELLSIRVHQLLGGLLRSLDADRSVSEFQVPNYEGAKNG
jgi:four helix bundle protein